MRRTTIREQSLGRSRVRLSRLLNESVEGVATRPVRSALILLGTLLGVGSFVTVLGVTSTANAQIAETFNAQSATEVTINFSEGAPTKRFAEGADQRVGAIHGAQGVGTYQDLDLDVTALPSGMNSEIPPIVRLTAVSGGFFDVADPRLLEGRLFDKFLERQPVAVVGERAARALGVTTLNGEPALYINGKPFRIVGLIASGSRVSAMASGVVIPLPYARSSLRASSPEAMTVVTDVGAGEQVAAQAPVALDPYRPKDVVAYYPPRATALKQSVSDQMRLLFLALAGVCMVIGSIGIVNVNLMAIIERTSEIGLRRSLGATRTHVVSQILVESSLLGAAGGALGGLVGEVAVVLVSVIQDWTPTLDARTLLAAPIAGIVVGILGGTYPAAKAARIEPVEAFRRA